MIDVAWRSSPSLHRTSPSAFRMRTASRTGPGAQRCIRTQPALHRSKGTGAEAHGMHSLHVRKLVDLTVHPVVQFIDVLLHGAHARGLRPKATDTHGACHRQLTPTASERLAARLALRHEHAALHAHTLYAGIHETPFSSFRSSIAAAQGPPLGMIRKAGFCPSSEGSWVKENRVAGGRGRGSGTSQTGTWARQTTGTGSLRALSRGSGCWSCTRGSARCSGHGGSGKTASSCPARGAASRSASSCRRCSATSLRSSSRHSSRLCATRLADLCPVGFFLASSCADEVDHVQPVRTDEIEGRHGLFPGIGSDGPSRRGPCNGRQVFLGLYMPRDSSAALDIAMATAPRAVRRWAHRCRRGALYVALGPRLPPKVSQKL
jgi:hypothetical protein